MGEGFEPVAPRHRDQGDAGSVGGAHCERGRRRYRHHQPGPERRYFPHHLDRNPADQQQHAAGPGFWRIKVGGALAITRSRVRLLAEDLAEPQPPAGQS